MTLKEMQERLNVLATEMRALHEKGDERSEDEESRLDAVIAEFNELGETFTEAKRKDEQRKAALDQANQYRQSAGRVSGMLPTAGAEQRDQESRKVDHRTLGQRFVESDQFEDFRKHGGKQSRPLSAGSFYGKHAAELQHRDGMGPEEVRALVQTGGLPADYILPTYVPGFFRGDDLQGTVRDVLNNGTTNSDSITFFRETAFTNAAAAVAQATATSGSTGLKPESAITFEQDSAPIVTVAHWIPITRQTLDDAPQIRTYVEGRLLDGLRLEESDQLLNGDGTGANMTGLLETTGVQLLDNGAASPAYWFDNPLASAGTEREDFDRILRARTLIRTVGRARANFVVINPADHERFLMSVNANQDYYGPGPFSGSGVANLWGLRVVEDENIAAGNALVGDGRLATVWDRMQAQILVDTINDQFVRNMLTLLAEERLGLTVFRPQAFAHVELAP